MKPKKLKTSEQIKERWGVCSNTTYAHGLTDGYNIAISEMEAHRKEKGKKEYKYDVVGSIQNLDERLHNIEQAFINLSAEVETLESYHGGCNVSIGGESCAQFMQEIKNKLPEFPTRNDLGNLAARVNNVIKYGDVVDVTKFNETVISGATISKYIPE